MTHYDTRPQTRLDAAIARRHVSVLCRGSQVSDSSACTAVHQCRRQVVISEVYFVTRATFWIAFLSVKWQNFEELQLNLHELICWVEHGALSQLASSHCRLSFQANRLI